MKRKRRPLFFTTGSNLQSTAVSCRRRLKRRNERATDNYSVIILFLSADAPARFLKYMLAQHLETCQRRIVESIILFSSGN